MGVCVPFPVTMQRTPSKQMGKVHRSRSAQAGITRRTWAQHVYALLNTLNAIQKSPWNFLSNVWTVVAVFLLPWVMLTVAVNAIPHIAVDVAQPEMSVFLSKELSSEEVLKIGRQIGGLPHVENVRLIPREMARKMLEKQADFKSLLAMLPENPLPDAYSVTWVAGISLEEFAAARKSIAALHGVDDVTGDVQNVQRTRFLWYMGWGSLLILVSLLALAVVTTVFNTVRLNVLILKDEIGVAHTVGATPRVIRRPFMYLGAAIGGLGALITLGLTAWVCVPAMNRALGEWSLGRALVSLDAPWVWGASLGAAVLGAVSAYLACASHLRSLP